MKRVAASVPIELRSPMVWLAAMVVLGLLVRLAQLLRPFDWFVSIFPADDFYYYANTAYNVAQGDGSSFDGGITYHNGYHPLFLWLLVPGYWLGLGKEVMVRMGIAILCVASLGSGVLAYQLGRALGGGRGSLIPALVITLGGYWIHQSLWGFETPLAILFVLATMLVTLRERSPVLIGIMLGLAILARIDNAILAPILGFHLWRRRGLRATLTVAAISLLLTLPWSSWSLLRFGTLLPISGVAKSLYADPVQAPGAFLVVLRGIPGLVFGDLSRNLFPGPLSLLVGALALVAGIWTSRREAWISIYVVASVIGFTVFTSPNQHVQLLRYTAPAVFVLSVLVFAVPWPRPRVWIPLVMLIVLVGSMKYVRWTLATEQRASFKGVCHRELPAILDAVAAPGERIGAFDSGALGYFAPRPVVNLDGLVNAELVGLLRSHDGRAWDRRYRDYLLRKQITIFVGGTGYSWGPFMKGFEDWEELHDPIPTMDGGEILILRVPARAESMRTDRRPVQPTPPQATRIGSAMSFSRFVRSHRRCGRTGTVSSPKKDRQKADSLVCATKIVEGPSGALSRP